MPRQYSQAAVALARRTQRRADALRHVRVRSPARPRSRRGSRPRRVAARARRPTARTGIARARSSRTMPSTGVCGEAWTTARRLEQLAASRRRVRSRCTASSSIESRRCPSTSRTPSSARRRSASVADGGEASAPSADGAERDERDLAAAACERLGYARALPVALEVEHDDRAVAERARRRARVRPASSRRAPWEPPRWRPRRRRVRAQRSRRRLPPARARARRRAASSSRTRHSINSANGSWSGRRAIRRTWPPASRARSSTVTRWPRSAATRAASRPARPAPDDEHVARLAAGERSPSAPRDPQPGFCTQAIGNLR